MARSICQQLALSCAALCVTVSATAQPSLLERGQHGIAASILAIDFSYAGSGAPLSRYDYQGSAFGITYAGTRMRAIAAYGRQNANHDILDVSLSLWGHLPFADVTAGRMRFGIPVGFLVGWRRVTKGANVEPYGVSSIGLGVGGALQQSFSQRAALYVRASPFIGFTSSQLVDQMGFSWSGEVDVQLDIDEAVGWVGLLAGYTFRYQFWNVNGSGPFSEAVDENLDYHGHMHVLRAGIKF